MKTLSQGQEVTFLFIVAATLTDISVQLNKGREHIKYITTPKTVRRRGGRASHPAVPPGHTHLCREARIFRVFWDVSITSTPSTLFVAFSSAKSFSPEATARTYQDPMS